MIKQYFIAPIHDTADIWMLAGIKQNGSYVWFDTETGSRNELNKRLEELNTLLKSS